MIIHPSAETRKLGRYALHWDYITDWYKTNMRRRMATREAVLPTDIVQPVTPQPSDRLQQQPTTAVPMPAAEKDETIAQNPATPKQGLHEEKTEELTETEQLVELEKQSHEVLFKANTVFPFTIFPHTIILDRTHLTVIHRTFFGVAKTSCVRIEDILTADLEVSPFFGGLKIATRFFMNQKTDEGNGNDIKLPAIKYLQKHDAMEVHKLLQGFIAATQREIDTSQIANAELIKLLRGLGQK